MCEIADDRLDPPDVVPLVGRSPRPGSSFGVLLMMTHRRYRALDEDLEVVAIGDLPRVKPLVALGRRPPALLTANVVRRPPSGMPSSNLSMSVQRPAEDGWLLVSARCERPGDALVRAELVEPKHELVGSLSVRLVGDAGKRRPSGRSRRHSKPAVQRSKTLAGVEHLGRYRNRRTRQASDPPALGIAEGPLQTLVPAARTHRCWPIRPLGELADAVLNEG